jgi:hypothetical protein
MEIILDPCANSNENYVCNCVRTFDIDAGQDLHNPLERGVCRRVRIVAILQVGRHDLAHVDQLRVRYPAAAETIHRQRWVIGKKVLGHGPV